VKNQPANLLPSQGEILYFPGFFSQRESDEFFRSLLQNIPWRQMPIKIFGKTVQQPRLTAWYADEGVEYKYSGLRLQAQPWIEPLSSVRLKIEKETGHLFNSALLNLYRDGNDSMGWHRDNEKALGPNPVIASLSLGAPRVFKLRKYSDKSLPFSLELQHGSLLLMHGESQHHWEHSIPKTKAALGQRINITFRKVLS
jgi:alkylated DNA repair dioxygenase AlkB